jgi:hypothetical protein
LAFIKEVTDDIVVRGVCSNTVINKCFEQHIEMNKTRLDEGKMRDVLSTLRRDLGMPSDDETGRTFFPLVSKEEKRTNR